MVFAWLALPNAFHSPGLVVAAGSVIESIVNLKEVMGLKGSAITVEAVLEMMSS